MSANGQYWLIPLSLIYMINVRTLDDSVTVVVSKFSSLRPILWKIIGHEHDRILIIRCMIKPYFLSSVSYLQRDNGKWFCFNLINYFFIYWVTSTLDILQLFNSDQKDNAVKEQVDSKNVHLITSIEKWEAKLSEATKDGKIVSFSLTCSWCKKNIQSVLCLNYATGCCKFQCTMV